MEYRIRHASFSFSVEKDHPSNPGEKIRAERKARQGEVVDIPFPEDVERGLRFGAFVTSSTPLPPNAEVAEALSTAPITSEPEPDLDQEEESTVVDMSDDELVQWIVQSRPNVQTVVDAAEGDADNARRLLEAEDKATGGDSRTGVIKGLTAIIGQA